MADFAVLLIALVLYTSAGALGGWTLGWIIDYILEY